MIGGMDPRQFEKRCNRCRFWTEHLPLRDPNDAEWGFGECRRLPPVLVSSLVDRQIAAPQYGNQTDLEVDPIHLNIATRFSVTHSDDWCGQFNMQPATAFAWREARRSYEAARAAELASADDAEWERMLQVRGAAEDVLMAIPSPDAAAFAFKQIVAHGDDRETDAWNGMLEAEAKRFAGVEG